MNLVIVSTDKKIFEKESSVRERHIWYGDGFDKIEIIVFTGRGFPRKDSLSHKVTAYATNSVNRIFYIFDAIRIGLRIIRAGLGFGKTTFVTCQDPFESGIVAYYLSKKFQLPLHIQIHTDLFSPYFANQSFLNFIRLQVAKKLIPKAARIRVVSNRIKNSLCEKYIGIGSKIKVTPIFTDRAPFERASSFTLREKYPNFNFFILMVGRLEAEKNYKLALLSMASIIRDFPKTALVIVGDGSELARLRVYAERLNISNNVFFEGNQHDLNSYYKSANIFLHASNYEGFGLVLLEAALSGLPIVTTNVGIASEVLIDKNSAFVCPIGDAACISKSISELLKQNDIRERLAFNAKNTASNFLISKKQYLENYL